MHCLVLFRDILSWQGWDPSAFKKEIGALILHQPMNPRVQEVVQRFILHYKDLGDPRNRVNGFNQMGRSASACQERLCGAAQPGEPVYVQRAHISAGYPPLPSLKRIYPILHIFRFALTWRVSSA